MIAMMAFITFAPEHADDGQSQHQRREGEKDIGDAHQHVIELAARDTRPRSPIRTPMVMALMRMMKTLGTVFSSAGHHPAQHIAAEGVGAHQVGQLRAAWKRAVDVRRVGIVWRQCAAGDGDDEQHDQRQPDDAGPQPDQPARDGRQREGATRSGCGGR